MSDPYFPEDKWVTANGLRMHYLDYGGDRTLKPLFLLHGITGNAHDWDDFAPKLSETHHVIAIDERGCGDTDWSQDGYSTQSYATDVGEFAKATGLYPFDYYGHSQGSRIGMALGAYYGDLIDHLVLGDYGPLPDPSPAGRETAQRRQGGGAPRPRGFFSPQQAFDWHKEATPDASDETLWHTVKHSYRSNWDGILVRKNDPEITWMNGRSALKEGPFMWDSVAKISCQTLVLRGAESNVLDLEQAAKMAATIPDGNGTCRELSGAGHGLHNENPDGALEILNEFFAS